MIVLTVTPGAGKLTAGGSGPTETMSGGRPSERSPSEPGGEECEGQSDDDDRDDSRAVELACSSLLAAAGVAVGTLLI